LSALVLKDVTVEYGDGDARVHALDGVNLTVAPGDFVAVAGPSGSGKSTLLAVAGALLRPTGGSVEIGRTDTSAVPGRRLATLRRERIGYVFQTANLLPSLTVRDQLLLIAHLAGRSATEDADELLDAVGMSGKAGRRPHQLSGGERQRVGIARALMNRPALLLADEPTANLDQRRAHEIVDLLAAQAHVRKAATVMVTHDAGLLDSADRVVRIRDGRLE
jgi:putative ABC transport system ATP-binding protein